MFTLQGQSDLYQSLACVLEHALTEQEEESRRPEKAFSVTSFFPNLFGDCL
jgi:hypothetical protein